MLTGRLTGVRVEVRVEWWRRWRGCGGGGCGGWGRCRAGRGGASIQFLDRALDSSVMQRRFPTVQTVLKTLDISQVPFGDNVVDCPLLCSLGHGPDSAVMRSSGQGR